MDEFQKYFGQALRITHPTVRDVEEFLAEQQGNHVVAEVHRIRDGLTYRPVSVRLRYYDPRGRRVRSETELWDDDLNSGLVHLGVRASDLDNEAVRFTLGLRPLLAKPDRRYGDGYFSTVLINHLRSTPLARLPEIARVLGKLHAPGYVAPGESARECEDAIRMAFQTIMLQLVDQLQYQPDEALLVLSKAVAQYLDDRFSLTNRALLGFG